MKLFVCVVALTALLVQVGLAQVALKPSNLSRETIDWSTIRRRDLHVPLPYVPEKLRPDDRVVGGQEAVPNAHPHQVALFISTPQGTFFCGGALISTNYVLTAAHCVEGATSVLVILGAHNIQIPEPGQLFVDANQYTLHGSWNPTALLNDIATLRLAQTVPLSQQVQLSILPTYGMVGNSFAGAPARITGWGLISDASVSISDVLHEVYTSVITNTICNIAFLGAIQATHLCTSGGGGVGACNGDSGGPVVSPPVQVGIVSFGLALGCEVGWPSAHTRLTFFLDWIAANSEGVTIFP